MPVHEYVLLAKQPIYDANINCHAYELLFRTPMGSAAMDFGADIATSQVLVNYCASVSEQSACADFPVFIQVDSEYLLEHEPLPVSPERVVISLAVSTGISEALMAGVRVWKSKGFAFALEGFDFDPKWEQLIPMMEYVKVDLVASGLVTASEKLPALLMRSATRWIATRVEDQEIYDACSELGFQYIQGNFLAKPKVVSGNSIRPGTAVTIKLLKALDRPGITMQQVVELVSQDPKLTIQVLKIINSSLFSLSKPVDNLHAALVYLGVDLLRQWAMMIAFLSNGNTHIEACRLVLLRAKTCELLCGKIMLMPEISSSAFLAGLVSGVDILLNVSVKEFLEQVNLSDEITDAVLSGKGELGDALNTVCALEYSVAQMPQHLAGTSSSILRVYEEANEWVASVIAALKT